MSRLAAVLLALALTAAACAQGPDVDESEQAQRDPAPAATGQSGDNTAVLSSGVETQGAPSRVRLFAVGDIGVCGSQNDDKVGRFLRNKTAPIALLGDIAYERGTPKEFATCFDPVWGPMFDRLYPSPGNHEYATEDARGYYGYFGERAVRPGRGWYAFNLGRHWKIIALNSQCGEVGGCGPDSPQGRWLAGALDRAGRKNVLAFFHVPRYSSGSHGSSTAVLPLFRALYRGGADIVLSGHDHSYERFAPQNAVGQRRARGVQQFVVGTGGRTLYALGPREKNSRARNNDTYGVLRLDLRRRGYDWKFIPVVGQYTDSGSRSLD